MPLEVVLGGRDFPVFAPLFSLRASAQFLCHACGSPSLFACSLGWKLYTFHCLCLYVESGRCLPEPKSLPSGPTVGVMLTHRSRLRCLSPGAASPFAYVPPTGNSLRGNRTPDAAFSCLADGWDNAPLDDDGADSFSPWPSLPDSYPCCFVGAKPCRVKLCADRALATATRVF